MHNVLAERIREQMRWEVARTGPPDGFPAFSPIASERYTSDLMFELEAQNLWPRVWVLAGRSEDVPEPGDHMVFDDLGVPIVIVRNTDGVLRAFYNTCQHRGAPVVRDARGSARQLRCQYHGWTYEIDGGTLVSLPDERDFVGLDRAAICLPPVRCETWDGWVFVNRDPDAESLLHWLGPVPGELAELGIRSEPLRRIGRTSEVIACNWKVAAEAFLEVYHFRHIHSHDGFTLLDNRGAAMGLLTNGHSRMVTPFSRRRCENSGMADWADWQDLKEPGFTDIATVDRMIRSTSTAYSVFPNLISPLAAYGYPVLNLWPIDPGHTRLDWTHYGPVDWEGDELPEHWQARLERFDRIMGEDTANMAPMQRSLESPALAGIRINYQERRIWHFHEQLDRMIGSERIPEAWRVAPLLGRYVES